MPANPFNRRLAATLLVMVAAVSVAVVTAASPASASRDRCCQVRLDNVPGQFEAGGDTGPFTLYVVNQTNETLRYLDVSFVLQAGGLVGDLVHLQRVRAVGGPHGVGTFTQQGVHSGVVTANDQIDFGMLALPPGGGADIQYQLSFNRKMPSTGLTISVQVQPTRNDAGASSAGPYQSTIVAAGQQIPTPQASTTAAAAPTTAQATDIAAAQAAQSSGPAAGTTSGGGSLMWLAYTIGALLVLGGIGVIGALLSRREPRTAATGPREPPARPTPPLAGHTAPTAQFPIPQDPYADPDQTWINPTVGR